MALSINGVVVSSAEMKKVVTPPNREKTDLFRGFPPNIFERLLSNIAGGETLAQACNRKGFPTEKTVRNRLSLNADMQRRYELAVNIRMDSLLDKTVVIADRALEGVKTVTASDRLRHADLKIRTIHAMIEKANPARYGKGQNSGDGGTVIVHNSLEVEAAQAVNQNVGVKFNGGGALSGPVGGSHE